jgi:chemotaxis protein CheX
MMDQQQVVNAVQAATQDVFSTMLGLEVVAAPHYTEVRDPGPSDGIIAVIGMAGAWVGTASICCNAAMACRISSSMLGMEYTEVNEDVLDAMSEIANMVIGNFKTTAEVHLGPLGLSIPTVIYGLNFSARTSAKEQWIVVPFACGADSVDVKICLTPNRGLPRLTNLGAAHTVQH